MSKFAITGNKNTNNFFINNFLKTKIMEKLTAQIKDQLAAILADIDKLENKAAKARVRKATLALEKLGKEYRKASVK